MSGVFGPHYTLPSRCASFSLSVTHTHTHQIKKEILLYSRLCCIRRREMERKVRDGESLGAGLCPGSPSLSGSKPSATAAAWL